LSKSVIRLGIREVINLSKEGKKGGAKKRERVGLHLPTEGRVGEGRGPSLAAKGHRD